MPRYLVGKLSRKGSSYFLCCFFTFSLVNFCVLFFGFMNFLNGQSLVFMNLGNQFPGLFTWVNPWSPTKSSLSVKSKPRNPNLVNPNEDQYQVWHHLLNIFLITSNPNNLINLLSKQTSGTIKLILQININSEQINIKYLTDKNQFRIDKNLIIVDQNKPATFFVLI